VPTLFPHRGIAEGVVEVGFDTRSRRPIMERRRWWRIWFDEPRDEIVPEFIPHERTEAVSPVESALIEAQKK